VIAVPKREPLKSCMQNGLASARIAFVDDDPRVQDSVCDALQRHEPNLIIERFDCGINFFDHYRQTKHLPPDIVLLDIFLGTKETGFDILEAALPLPMFENTLFVSFSAYTGSNDERWLGYLGFDHSIDKGDIPWDDLAELLATFLTRRQESLSQRAPLKNLIAAVRELSRLRLRTSILEKNFITRLIAPNVFALLENNPGKLEPKLENATIGFADIRGFVQLMNRTEIAQINDILKHFFTFASKTILDEKCFIDKFIGDAVMWFNYGVNAKEAANSCICVAVKIAQGLEALNKEIQNAIHLKVKLNVGFGVASGTCAIGMFGSPEHRIQYSTIGPAVNLASRLCSEAKNGQVLIGGDVIKYCTFATRRIGFKSVKGFDHKVEIRAVEVPAEERV
jgi:class 3 adenylate cyclase